jgi:hypothetical protein
MNPIADDEASGSCLRYFRRIVGARAGWLSLNRISQSFLAKGVTILSLTAFVLANFPWVESALGNSGWRIQALFMGSLFFVIGHVLAAAKAPPEFNGRSEATQIVAEMLVLDTKEFFEGRRLMLEQLVKRFKLRPPFDLPNGPLQLAELELKESADSPNPFKDHSRGIYHADIQLRQFDKPRVRLSALVLLGFGMALMLVPTVLNVFRTLWQFLPGGLIATDRF